MRILVQRSLQSNVEVDKKEVGSIYKGLVILVGFKHGDNESDIDYLINKLINLRIFEDENGLNIEFSHIAPCEYLTIYFIC